MTIDEIFNNLRVNKYTRKDIVATLQFINQQSNLVLRLKTRIEELEHANELIKAKSDNIKISVMKNIRRVVKSKYKKSHNWALYTDVFATGSTTANKECERLNIDPDTDNCEGVIWIFEPPKQ